ncbi:MAG: hypothetical protein ABL927_07000 [Bdellovibrionales bacterium]
MEFEELFFKPAHESALLDQLVIYLQANYATYQNSCYFIKLFNVVGEKSGLPQNSQIVWVKAFTDMYVLGDYFYDTVNERACILVKFEEGRYELLIHGFQLCDRFKIWPDKISERRPIEINWNRENKKIIDRELLERGFGEITSTLFATKRDKSV